jgi:hypothetical protein
MVGMGLVRATFDDDQGEWRPIATKELADYFAAHQTLSRFVVDDPTGFDVEQKRAKNSKPNRGQGALSQVVSSAVGLLGRGGPWAAD